MGFICFGFHLLYVVRAQIALSKFDPSTDFQKAICTVLSVPSKERKTRRPRNNGTRGEPWCEDRYIVRFCKHGSGMLQEKITMYTIGGKCDEVDEKPLPFSVGDSVACWEPAEGKEASNLTKFYRCVNEACISLKQPTCQKVNRRTKEKEPMWTKVECFEDPGAAFIAPGCLFVLLAAGRWLKFILRWFEVPRVLSKRRQRQFRVTSDGA